MSNAGVTNGYANMISSGSGGAFYFTGPRVSLTVTGFSTAAKLQFSTSQASTSGGWLYLDNS